MVALRELWGRRAVRNSVVIAALIVILLAATLCRGASVPAARVVRAPIVETLVVNGRVLAKSKSEIGSVQTGRVQTVAVEEGDRVIAGQLLVQLDDAEARAAAGEARGRLGQAEARLDQLLGKTGTVESEKLRQARARFENAERTWKRKQELHASGIAPQSDVDDAAEALSIARSAVDSAEAESSSVRGTDARLARASVDEARAALAAATTRVAQMRITAPAAGTIIDRLTEPGAVVRAGDKLLVMTLDSATQLIAEPDEKNLGSLRVGQTARASADAFPERSFEARVSYVAPSVDIQRGTIEVRFDVPTPPDYLRTDMTLSIEIESGNKPSALVVPSEALRGTTGAPKLLVVERGRAIERDVRTGARGAGLVEIADGVKEGDTVLLPNGPLAVGDRVRPKLRRDS